MNGSEWGQGWQLLLEEKVAGYLNLRGVDQPIFFCDFEPTPEFAAYAPLFAEELRLLNADLVNEWMSCYARIEALEPRLVGGGEDINELLLHIEGDTAWFRY